MKVTETAIQGVLIIEPDLFGDARGFFMETFSERRYADAGISGRFVQDNMSSSSGNVLRGLHLQHPVDQSKLVTVISGAVYDVAVDVRVGSPSFGSFVAVELTGDNHLQFLLPEGFAHGFCVTSDHAVFAYKCTDYYSKATEIGIRWDDPDIGIPWPVTEPSLSDKDLANPLLRDIAPDRLPVYRSRT